MNLKEAQYAFADGYCLTMEGEPVYFPLEDRDYQIMAEVGDLALYNGRVYYYTDEKMRKVLFNSTEREGLWWYRPAEGRLIRFVGDSLKLQILRKGREVPKPQPHVHREAIRAVAEGREVEYCRNGGRWEKLEPGLLSFSMPEAKYRVVDMPSLQKGDTLVLRKWDGQDKVYHAFIITTVEEIYKLHPFEFQHPAGSGDMVGYTASTKAPGIMAVMVHGLLSLPATYGQPVKVIREGWTVWAQKEQTDD